MSAFEPNKTHPAPCKDHKICHCNDRVAAATDKHHLLTTSTDHVGTQEDVNAQLARAEQCYRARCQYICIVCNEI